KIIVAHDGVGPPFTDPTPRPSPVEPPFFLSVGNLQPRKNVATLVAAYRQAVRRRPDLPERLVIVRQEWFAADRPHRDPEDLGRRGRERAARFTWERSARAILRGIEKACR